MSQSSNSNHWKGIKPGARARLAPRDYSASPIEERIGREGMEAGVVVASEKALRDAGVWIPGVELMHRTIHPQRHRGVFGELGRQEEGILGTIGLWPRQWAAARMYAGSAKGFHIHPPHVPKGMIPGEWFQKLYAGTDPDYSLRPYAEEQWDVMYFLNGRTEILLVDERDGLPRLVMRVFIDGDNHRGANNAALVIPPGVAHALRAESSEDLVMVYGTTTTFNPDHEGRIASEVEICPLPDDWSAYLSNDSK